MLLVICARYFSQPFPEPGKIFLHYSVHWTSDMRSLFIRHKCVRIKFCPTHHTVGKGAAAGPHKLPMPRQREIEERLPRAAPRLLELMICREQLRRVRRPLQWILRNFREMLTEPLSRTTATSSGESGREALKYIHPRIRGQNQDTIGRDQ